MSEQFDPFDNQPESPKIVAISLQRTGHLFSFLSAGLSLKRGDRVVVEYERLQAGAELPVRLLIPAVWRLDGQRCQSRRSSIAALEIYL